MNRCFDLFLSVVALLFLAPLLVVIACMVKIQDGGPVFYKQERVGYKGRMFRIWKFRSMRIDAEQLGPSITAAGDPRVTSVGRLLRRTKMDELPQLINVLKGEMAFVGPRPEVPRYVRLYRGDQIRVLDLVPGITDVASIEFRNEEELLKKASDPDVFYIEQCMPKKISLNLAYADERTFFSDLAIIIRTIGAIVLR